MTIKLTTLALIAAFAVPTIAHAGGPIIIEDATEAVAPRHDRKIGGILFAVSAVALIAALANGSGNCVSPDDTPAPTPEPGC